MNNIGNNLSFHFHKTYTVFMKNCESYQVSCEYYTPSTIYITVCCECRFSQFYSAFNILTALPSKFYLEVIRSVLTKYVQFYRVQILYCSLCIYCFYSYVSLMCFTISVTRCVSLLERFTTVNTFACHNFDSTQLLLGTV